MRVAVGVPVRGFAAAADYSLPAVVSSVHRTASFSRARRPIADCAQARLKKGERTRLTFRERLGGLHASSGEMIPIGGAML
jgi:hypothetical protein